MEQRYVGRSGLRVSTLGLGTLTWGRETDEHEARDLLKAFVNAEGTLVDSADGYGGGIGEEVLGSLLGDVVARREVVLATKAGFAGPVPDASARALLAALDQSLQRLGTDHVDLWLAPGWDSAVPVQEVLRALGAAVASGRARYAGVVSDSGWQLATAAVHAGASQLPLVAAATEHSLLHRAAEAEVLPAARHHGLGVLAWAPLARGALTGKYRAGVPLASRGHDALGTGSVLPYLGREHRRVIEAVLTAAEGLGVLPLEVALAWARDSPGVSAVLVGARTAEQLEQLLYSSDLVLPVEIRAALDDVSAAPR